MEQLQLDFTRPVEDVIRDEPTTWDGESLFWQAEMFYQKNSALLAAHVEAAKVFERHDKTVSARALTEFVRYLNTLGPDGVAELARAYESVDWTRDEPYAIANASSAWLSRYLAMRGFDVSISKSKIDEEWERVHGA